MLDLFEMALFGTSLNLTCNRTLDVIEWFE